MLTIDHRERKIKDAFDGTEGVDYLVKELPVGDFMVSYDDSPEKMWLCERKTGTDLSASIKSGRWRDQLARLYETGHRVVVMIEGDLRNGGLPQKSLMGAWINASMRKRFTVYRTADVWGKRSAPENPDRKNAVSGQLATYIFWFGRVKKKARCRQLPPQNAVLYAVHL